MTIPLGQERRLIKYQETFESMLWSSQRKFSEKCSKVNGNQGILGVKRCILVDFDAKFQENRVSTVKVNGNFRKWTIT